MTESNIIADPTHSSQRPRDHLCFQYAEDQQFKQALAAFLAAGGWLVEFGQPIQA